LIAYVRFSDLQGACWQKEETKAELINVALQVFSFQPVVIILLQHFWTNRANNTLPHVPDMQKDHIIDIDFSSLSFSLLPPSRHPSFVSFRFPAASGFAFPRCIDFLERDTAMMNRPSRTV
jgi:hypothetical protein